MDNEGKDYRRCPYCKEEIRSDAIKCKHCRSSIAPDKPEHGGVCPFCKEDINQEAIKCKHCGSAVGPAAEHECEGCGGAQMEGEMGFMAAKRKPKGTGSRDLDCALAWAGCTINCSLKHPDDPLMQQACEDSCDAARRLCRSTGGGSGGIFIF